MTQNKKDFAADVAGVFVDTMITPATTPPPEQEQQAQKRTPKREAQKPATNLSGTDVKVCYTLDATLERKLRYIAFAENCRQKAIVTTALQEYIKKYEAKHGEIQ